LRPAGDQDEVGVESRLEHQACALVADQQAAVEAFPDLDAAPGIGAAGRAARDLDEARAEADGVVPGHPARVAAAEAIGEVAGRPLPGRRGLSRGLGKVAVVVDEVEGQEGLGRLEGVDPAEAELSEYTAELYEARSRLEQQTVELEMQAWDLREARLHAEQASQAETVLARGRRASCTREPAWSQNAKGTRNPGSQM